MTTTRPTRYGIPTWVLVLVALAGVVGLILTDPVASVGAPLEELPPPLPLDELPATGPVVDPVPAIANVAGILLLAGAILWGLYALSDRSSILAWLRGGSEAVAELDRDARDEKLRAAGYRVHVCPLCDGRAWASDPDVDLLELHRTIARTCPA